MERQIPEEQLGEYTQAYLAKCQNMKRGPKTPEGIAKAAKNLLRKQKGYGSKVKMPDCAIQYDTLENDSNFTEHQKSFYGERYNKLTEKLFNIEVNERAIIHWQVLQEMQIRQFYREINLVALNIKDKERIMKLLAQAMDAYIKIQEMKNLNHINMENMRRRVLR